MGTLTLATGDIPWALLDNVYNNRFQKLTLHEVPVRQLTIRSAWNYRLFLERPEWFAYTTPGMFALLGKRNPVTGRVAVRAFSIASAPHEDFLEFYITVKGETVSDLPPLDRDDPDLDKVLLQYPYVSLLLQDVVEKEVKADPAFNNVLLGQATMGSFRFDPKDQRVAVFGFTGTGVAAGVPVVREYPWAPSVRRGILLHGVRNPVDFRLPGRVQGVPAALPGVPVPHVPQPGRRDALALRSRPDHEGAGAKAGGDDGRYPPLRAAHRRAL